MREYGLTTLFLWGLVAMALASHGHGRWLEGRVRVSTVTVYLAVLGVLSASGVWLLGPSVWWRGDLLGLLFAVPAGVLMAVLTWYADTTLVRRLVKPKPRPVRTTTGRARPIGMAAGGKPEPRRTNQWRDSDRDAATRIGVGSLVTGAVLEEVVYRGVLVRIAFETPVWSAVVLLVLAVFAFALSHLPFGWPQAVAKLPLSVLAMVVTLATGTLLAAVIGHVLFNLKVWQRYRRTGGAL
ncbi:type II CAAX endopeptidase family protein [Lentzea sp. NPDC051838]|uniref:CPBP family intramembrane glutamic endopeptidase n=1 Tax=Lentzea sp. NPDC051838 TaxID=3154849 RepID=UPI00341F209E